MQFLKELMGCKKFLVGLWRLIKFKFGVADSRRSVAKVFADTLGQSTVEFAIVTAALLVIVIALGVFLNMTDTGMLVQHALSSASHNLSGAMLGIVGDVFSV